jgi:hypothetical protein
MIPIKDTIHSRSFPLVTWLLVIANVLIFVLIELPLNQLQLERLIGTFGVTHNLCAAPILNGISSASIPGWDIVQGCRPAAHLHVPARWVAAHHWEYVDPDHLRR